MIALNISLYSSRSVPSCAYLAACIALKGSLADVAAVWKMFPVGDLDIKSKPKLIKKSLVDLSGAASGWLALKSSMSCAVGITSCKPA